MGVTESEREASVAVENEGRRQRFQLVQDLALGRAEHAELRLERAHAGTARSGIGISTL